MATRYVDHSAANDGDGTAANQAAAPGAAGAFNTFTGHMPSVGDTYWCRKKDGAYAAILTFSNNTVKVIGWPEVGDDYYASRPQSGIDAGWDADPTGYCQFSITANNADSIIISGGTGQEFHRIKNVSVNTTAGSHIFRITVGCLLKNVFASSTGNVTRNGFTCITVPSGTLRMYSCSTQFTSTSASTGFNFTNAGVAQRIYLNSCVNIDDCTSQKGFSYSQTANTTEVYIEAVNCTFVGRGNTAIYLNWSATTMTGRIIFDGGSAQAMTAHKAFYTVAGATNNLVEFCFIEAHNLAVLGGSGVQIDGPGWYFLNFKQLVQDFSATNGIQVLTAACGSFYAENVIFKIGNSSGDIFTGGMPVIIKNAIFQNSTEVYSTSWHTLKNCYCLDYNGNVGAWKAWVDKLELSSDLTYRTGGEAFSIKIIPKQDVEITDQPLGWVGIPGQETIFAYVPSGSAKVLTLYGAYKLWGGTPPTQGDIWMEGSYYAAAAPSATLTSFSTRDYAGTALTADGVSTWVGDSGMTNFKISITLATVGQNSLIPIRILLSKFVSGGYIYLDPKLTVE